jgi:hypothetical protein
MIIAASMSGRSNTGNLMVRSMQARKANGGGNRFRPRSVELD